MNELFELYQEIILDHNKRPRNYREIDRHTHFAEGSNPICGDEISVYLKVDEGKIEDVSFQGEGCAISKASASLMTTGVRGKTVVEAKAEFEKVREMLTGPADTQVDLDEVGNVACLSGVRQFPARIKCATLAWHALNAALEGETGVTTE